MAGASEDRFTVCVLRNQANDMINETREFTHPVGTDAGLCALWQPEHFEHVTDLDSFHAELIEDQDIERHIADGAFVPINIGSDGGWGMTVRVGAGLNDREAQFLVVSSEPYRIISRGTLGLGGLENIGSYGGGAIVLPIDVGTYSAIVHLIDWESEPGSRTEDGAISTHALPDFVVELHEEAATRSAYRKTVETFERAAARVVDTPASPDH